MKNVVVCALLLVSLVGCFEDRTPVPPPPGPTDEVDGGGTGLTVSRDIDVTVGDVEQKVPLQGTVEVPYPPNVVVDEQKDPRSRITRTTVDVYWPYPASLPITFRIKSERAFPDTPVAVRARIQVEGIQEPVARFAGVFGEQAYSQEFVGMVDLVKVLPTIPESVLVTGWVEAVLLPRGTLESEVDPVTATSDPEFMTEYLGNPVRVNFHNEPMPASAQPEQPAEPEAPAPPAPPLTLPPTMMPPPVPALPGAPESPAAAEALPPPSLPEAVTDPPVEPAPEPEMEEGEPMPEPPPAIESESEAAHEDVPAPEFDEEAEPEFTEDPADL